MRTLKLLLVGLALAIPGYVLAAANEIPGTATWYLHVDLQQMRSAESGKALYSWMQVEIFDEVRDESGVDIGKELDSVTAFSMRDQGPVFLFQGNISQESKDKVMTLIATQGDLKALKSSRKSYYRLTGNGESGDKSARLSVGSSIDVQIESLEDESWVSFDVKNKLIVTATEEQMIELLKTDGRIPGSGSHNGALVVLTAEKALLQAGMNSSVLGSDDDGDSSWDSNILRNTEQVAFLVAAAANKLAIEAQLITAEAEMAESLASVVRGLIGLMSFSDEMDADLLAVVRGTKVQTKGNTLSISMAIDPDLVVSTLSD